MREQRGNLLIVILIGVGIASLIYLIASPGSEPISPVDFSDISGDIVTDNGGQPTTSGDFPKGDEIIRAEQFTLGGVSYILELVATVDSNGNRRVYQRLASQLAGVRRIVVSDIDREITDLGAYVLTKFVVSEPNKLVVFAAEVGNPALPMGSLYKFDVATGKFTKMFVSRFLPRHLDPEDNASVFSPDKIRFLSINDRTQSIREAKSIYLVNLVSDQAKVIGAVSAGETLTQNISQDGDVVGSYRWLDSTNVEYSIFSIAATMPRTAISAKNYFVNPADR